MHFSTSFLLLLPTLAFGLPTNPAVKTNAEADVAKRQSQSSYYESIELAFDIDGLIGSLGARGEDEDGLTKRYLKTRGEGEDEDALTKRQSQSPYYESIELAFDIDGLLGYLKARGEGEGEGEDEDEDEDTLIRRQSRSPYYESIELANDIDALIGYLKARDVEPVVNPGVESTI